MGKIDLILDSAAFIAAGLSSWPYTSQSFTEATFTDISPLFCISANYSRSIFSLTCVSVFGEDLSLKHFKEYSEIINCRAPTWFMWLGNLDTRAGKANMKRIM